MILQGYKSLFAECFRDNLEVEDGEVSLEDLKVLQELEPDEVLENIRDLMRNLIEFKRFVRRAEENEESEIEICDVYLPAKEESQGFRIVRSFSEANEQLKRENLNLQNDVKMLEKKLREKEEFIKEKNLEIIEIRKKGSFGRIGEDKGKGSFEFAHARINSEIMQICNTRNKCSVIKSVKFEYFPSSAKRIETRMKPIMKKKFMNSTVSSPEKFKSSHSRSNSNALVNSKKSG